MQDIDFIELFLSALKCASAAEYFTRFYGIDFNEPSIQTDAFDNVLSPLLLIHFVCLLEKLLKHGLKKGFVRREENLNGKIKGRILIAKNIQKNLRTQRQERTYCGYQEWTVDTLENRILKKALKFSRQMLKTLHISEHPKLKGIDQSITRMLFAFEQVGNEIQSAQVRQIKVNKCWREYAEALKVAQMILHRFEYSVEKAGQKQTSVPPFWIDMSRLYEVYVYSKLFEVYGNEIGFQVKGYYNSAVDFIKKDERLIMDTKYKPQYGNSNSGIIDDIRQISGYARDTRILQALGEDKNSTKEIKCIIIFPETYKTDGDEKEIDTDFTEKTTFSQEEKLLQKASEIPHFRNFFKLRFPLPRKKGR
ncbi:MAG: McrC family protein [Treponemataceae bacterium]|nr:McrC family protein [Treponemataceae bacterium]